MPGLSVTATYHSRSTTRGRRSVARGVYIYPPVTLPVTHGQNGSNSNRNTLPQPDQHPEPILIAKPAPTEEAIG